MDYKTINQDRLSEGFKDCVSGIRSADNDGQIDWSLCHPLHSEYGGKHYKNNSVGGLLMPLNDNQQEAVARAIKQLKDIDNKHRKQLD